MRGIADGLALASRNTGPAVALCGKSWHDDLPAALGAVAAAIVFHADDDAAGRDAALQFRVAVNGLYPGMCRAVVHRVGSDPADAASAAGFDTLPAGWDAGASTREQLRRASAGAAPGPEQGLPREVPLRSPQRPRPPCTSEASKLDAFTDYPVCPHCREHAPGPELTPCGWCLRCYIGWPELPEGLPSNAPFLALLRDLREPLPEVEREPVQMSFNVAPEFQTQHQH